jgi:hypothetical protein
MATGPRYFLSENGQRTGPHSLVVLKQKAEVHVLKPETSIAPESDPDDWTPISASQVLCEELFPARRPFTLGARTVEKVNTSADPHAAPSIEEMLRDNLARQQSAGSELLKPLPPRSNRRLKDYLFTVVAGALVSMIPWLFVPVNIGHVFISLAATAFVALCAAWVFFVVMDRY